MKAAFPMNEEARLDALYQCKILDTSPEEQFDNITQLASRICETPIALINLIDRDRQWFKSKVGIDLSEVSRDVGLCPHAILERGPFIVRDASQDARFTNNPMVTSYPYVRFYAGVPLVTSSGHALGTLCVIDQTPRQLGRERLEALKFLVRQVVSLLESRRQS